MEKDEEKQSHWFDIPTNQYMLGVRIERNERQFVYVVTHPAKDSFAGVHPRMPMLVNAEAGTPRADNLYPQAPREPSQQFLSLL